MADFAALADVEAFLIREITEAAEIASVNRALAEASAAIRNYTKQYIGLVEDETITLDSRGGWRVYLPELPVISVSEVIEDGDLLTAEDDYKLGEDGILTRVGQVWASGIQILEISYTHGYAIIPDDIAGVCTRAAARAFQAGLKASDSDGVPGIASKSLGDFSVSFSGEGGSAGDGVMGASAARFLLMSEKDILDKYRVKGP